MDTKLLHAFQLTYRRGSIRQAAGELYITPQGLSRNLQTLERDLGVTLFERTKQGIVPTAAGMYLYEHSDEMDRYLARLRDDLAVISAKNQSLSLAACFGSLCALSYQSFAQFQEQHPDLDIAWNELTDVRARNQLEDGLADIALLPMDLSKQDERYTSDLLTDSGIVALVGEGHPLYDRQAITLEDLRDETIVIVGDDFWMHGEFRRCCEARGFTPDIPISVGDITVCPYLSSQGVGIGIVPDFIADLTPVPGLRVIPLDEPGYRWRVYANRDNRRLLSPGARAFYQFFLPNA